MKYTKEQYEEFDVSEGDDIDIRCRTTRLVKTKKPHKCCLDNGAHIIPVESMAVRDSAIVDGEWSTVYSCTDCIDKWYDECEMYEPQTTTPDLTGGEG